MNRLDRIEWVYSARNNDELRERYDAWAKDYEIDLIEAFGRVVHDPFIDAVVKYVVRQAHILDAGAGTGLVGQYLSQLGYHNLTAIDFSTGMLDQARQKHVYTALYQMVLGEPLAFPDSYFEAVICSGVFTIGHAPACAFDELIRVTRPGGYILFTLRPDFYAGSEFKQKLPALATAGQLTVVENQVQYRATPKGDPTLMLQVWVCQVA
jgi:SAM-dependent methyltransferase